MYPTATGVQETKLCVLGQGNSVSAQVGVTTALTGVRTGMITKVLVVMLRTLAPAVTGRVSRANRLWSHDSGKDQGRQEGGIGARRREVGSPTPRCTKQTVAGRSRDLTIEHTITPVGKQ